MSPTPGPIEQSKKPRRALAVVLSLVGPLGVGQLYLGQRERAWWWLGAFAAGFVVLTFSLPPLGAVLGYGKVLAFVLASGLAYWIASVFDVLAISEAQVKRVRWLALLGFWLAGSVMWFVLGALIRAYAIEAFKVPSGSMQPTLLANEHIMCAKGRFLSLPPERGEAVVFKLPENPAADYVKRVMGLPGDTLQVKSGHPWLNGWEVPHCRVGKTALPDARPGCSGILEVEFLAGHAYPVFFDECSDEGNQGPYHVASDEIWVLGDNRNNSSDSRSWRAGQGAGVPFENFRGPIWSLWFPPERLGVRTEGAPVLPTELRSLAPALATCLGKAPSLADSTPPHR